ncbi:uncharacterized protein [Dysidea avara]|uniref:uncharacterized protein isoform X2 n=1 Tax=Dysidea avara TaxID=196820 RepID=UPI003321A17E
MKIQTFMVIVYLSEVILAAVIITNGPQDTTVCVNQFVNFTCGFTEADPNLVVPNWHIIERNRNGVIVSDETISGTEINRDTNDGLEWIADPLNGNNSVLRVGPVSETDDQSSYQCIFAVLNDNVESDMGTLTVLGTPSIDNIAVDFIRVTVIAISWTSTSSVSYGILLTAAGAIISSTSTNDTQYSFNGLTNGTSYMISVIPRNQICQGEGVDLMVIAGVMPTVTTTTTTTMRTTSTHMVSPTRTIDAQDIHQVQHQSILGVVDKSFNTLYRGCSGLPFTHCNLTTWQ